jgi:P4 family phage/plasmid primase-like protien
MNSSSQCLDEALKHFDAGRTVVPCNGKQPVGSDWANAWRDRAKLASYFERNAEANLGLVFCGDLIDFEWDSEEEKQAFQELFDGSEVPRTPNFASTRGEHYLFKAHPRLLELGQGVVYYKKLCIRVGGGGKQIQSVIPPSRNADGKQREWNVSFDDCEAAELPESVVDQILEFQNPVAASNAPTIETSKSSEPSFIDAAVAAMLAMMTEDKGDGSTRLFAYACRAIEHNLNDADAIAAIRQASTTKLFPKKWADREIIKRLRDAEKRTTRGLAIARIDLWTPEGRTDTANARRLAASFGDVIRWCDPWRKWLVWDGRRWKIDERRTIDEYAKTVADKLWTEAAKNRENETVWRFVRATSNAHGIANMVSLARSERGLSIVPSQMDKDHFALNVGNGILDLRTGRLRSHDPSAYFTKLAPVDYVSDAECPIWTRFLDTVFAGDQELIQFVKRLGGYCLTGSVNEHILAILHGTGANGKSTLLNGLLEICGDYAFKASDSLLVDRPGDSHPTSIADLAGKRIAFASETEEGGRLNEAKIKELTGGERVRARRMREDNWEFEPTHKILVATNFMPEIKGTNYAIWRRIRLIPFNVTIAEADRDKELADKLRGEYPGILRWLVEGCLDWQSQKLGNPKSVADATALYREAEDTLGDFLERRCEVSSTASAGSSELLVDYQEYSGDRRMTAKRFAKLLNGRGYKVERATSGPFKGRMIWRGLRLAPVIASVELPGTGATSFDQTPQLAA